MRTLHMYIVGLLLIITVFHRLDAQTITVSNSRTDGSSCVGDSLLFTCVANHTTFLLWYVEPFFSEERAIQFGSYEPIGLQYYSMTFTATLVNKVQYLSDSRYADLVSTLEVTVTPELNGSRVWCSATGLGNGDVFEDIIMKGPPSSPHSLNYTVLDSNLQIVTLLIQWSLQHDTAMEKFIISVYSTAANYTVHSNVTKIILTLPYNENYNISVRAIDCGERSRAAVLYHISISRCNHPRAPENGTIKLYHSLAEGSEISYHCNTGYAPHEEMTAVCTHQGVWSHNPNELECLRDCGVPRPPLNGYVEPYNSTAEGGEVFYQCRKGYSPSNVRMRAVCTAEGVWNPNPSHLSCTGSVQLDKNNTVISAAIVGSILFFLILVLCVFLLGSLLLCWRKRHQRTTTVNNEPPPPAMVTVRSDPLYEEIHTQVGEESFVLKENAAYGPRPRIN